MGDFFWLSDEAWAAIEPHLPKNQPGARCVDDRRVISGIVHVLKSGCRWRDCPPVYGPRTTIYNRFNRWSRRCMIITAAFYCRGFGWRPSISTTRHRPRVGFIDEAR